MEQVYELLNYKGFSYKIYGKPGHYELVILTTSNAYRVGKFQTIVEASNTARKRIDLFALLRESIGSES